MAEHEVQSLSHFLLFAFCTKQKKTGLSCITQLRIPVKTLQPFFFGLKKPMGPATVVAPFLFPCGARTWKTEKGGGSVREGGATFVWKKEVGPPLKRLPVSDDWQKPGGESRWLFNAHGTPKPRKTRGFCIRRTSKNMSSAITTACRANY